MVPARTSRRLATAILLGVALPGLLACDLRLPVTASDAGTLPVAARPTRYGPTVNDGTSIAAYTWDLEAYWMAFAGCGQGCPFPPITVPGTPLFSQSVVSGVQMAVFDPIEAGIAVSAAAPTAADGTWSAAGLPSREVPFFAVSSPHPVRGSDGGTEGAYAPTLTLRPIATGRSYECLGVASLVASDLGILDAVAKHKSSESLTYGVSDLLIPTNFGGLAIWWRFMPGSSNLRVPAFGTTMEASSGETLQLDWAPPGALPPEAHQSVRGFFVTDAPVSPIGVSVTLLPPLSGPPTPVTFRMQDPVTDAAAGRPYSFPSLPPMVLAPGRVSFGEIQALSGTGAPPPWVCVP